jgi:hypothetical protein
MSESKNVFDKYLEALEAKNAGDLDTAADRIAQSLGGEKGTTIIRANVDLILKTGSRINKSITDNLFSAEVSRRRKEKESAA